MKKFILPLFGIMCLAQWYIPGEMIYHQETILREGKVFKFKTAPIDPADPFRGKYITLNFEASTINIVDPKEWDTEYIYVSLDDSAGFAAINTVSMYEPENADYIKAKIQNISYYEPYVLTIAYPFDRFFLEESKASEAERLYWQSLSDSTQTTYAVVSVKDGEAALQDVMINDKSIVDIVRSINVSKP